MNEELLIRYLTQQCSPEELKEVEQWLAQSPDHARQLFELEQVAALRDELHYDRSECKEHAWQQIQARIAAKHTRHTRTRIYRYLSWGVAAAITVLLLLDLFRPLAGNEAPQVTETWTTVYAPIGQRASVTLADGTQVDLNAGTTLRYPDHLAQAGQRRVVLDGEARFSVKADSTRPFYVKTRLLNIRVTGTLFNVKAYAGESNEIGLLKGKVEVECDSTRRRIRLRPNELLTVSPDADMQLKADQNLDNFCAWTEGEIAYTNRTLQEICRDLERRFDVHIIIQDKGLAEKVFTCHAVGKDISIDRVLDLLKDTHQLTYRKRNRTYKIMCQKVS